MKKARFPKRGIGGAILLSALTACLPLAISAQSVLWAWGDNTSGALGDGARDDQTRPVRVTLARGLEGVRSGAAHTVGIAPDGSLVAWGDNRYGQLGDGTRKDRNRAVTVKGLTGIRAVACGENHTLALKASGTVWAWGHNESGQLGTGNTSDRSSPVRVGDLAGIIAVKSGAGFSLALDSGGTVWAWGDNRHGQLGTSGPAGFGSHPVAVAGLAGVASIEAGGRHAFALKSDGTLWAWGDNLFGQLGADTSTTWSPVPVLVEGLFGILALRAGREHSAALKIDGTAWAWGGGFRGQLGDGAGGWRRHPAQVPGLSGLTSLASGADHCVAIREDGSLWAWGANANGQLGDGSQVDRFSPVQIEGLAAASDPRACWDRSFAFADRAMSITSLAVQTAPFRIVVKGLGFASGVKVFIHGWQWPLVTWKDSRKLVIKGGQSLRSNIPRDTPTEFKFVNPDGETVTTTWQWH